MSDQVAGCDPCGFRPWCCYQRDAGFQQDADDETYGEFAGDFKALIYFEKHCWGRFAIWLTKMDWKYQVLMYLKGCSIQLELDVMLVHHTGANELTKSTDFTVTGENWNLSDFLHIIVGLKIGLLLLDDFQATFLLWIKLAQNLFENHEESIWCFQECWHLSFFGAIGWGTERFMAVLELQIRGVKAASNSWPFYLPSRGFDTSSLRWFFKHLNLTCLWVEKTLPSIAQTTGSWF